MLSDDSSQAVNLLTHQALSELKEHNSDKSSRLAHEALELARSSPEMSLSEVLHLQNHLSEAFAGSRLHSEAEAWDAEIEGCLQDLSDSDDQISLKDALNTRRRNCYTRRVSNNAPLMESHTAAREPRPPSPPKRTPGSSNDIRALSSPANVMQTTPQTTQDSPSRDVKTGQVYRR